MPDGPVIGSAAILECVAGALQIMDVPAEEKERVARNTPLRRNYSWAHLMMRVFAIDVLECGRCGGRLRILSAIHPPETTTKILSCLGLPSRAPPLTPAVSAATFDSY